MKSVTLSTRLSQIETQEVDSMAAAEGLDRAAFLKQLIKRGIEDYKLERALNLYRRKKISLSKAAELSGMSIHDLVALFPEHSVELNYSVEDLKQDLV